jgi:hypothetical protein
MIYALTKHGFYLYWIYTIPSQKMNVFFPLISLFLGQWISKFQKITCLNYWKCEKSSFFS